MVHMFLNTHLIRIHLMLFFLCFGGITFILERGLTANNNTKDGLRFTELLASNISGLKDAEGDTNDWLEMQNTRSHAVSLSGYHLTDNLNDRMKWALPNDLIPSEGIFVIWMSGKNIDQKKEKHTHTPNDSVFPIGHASFKLKKKGGSLFLIDPNNEIVDQIKYPKQYSDRSYGRSAHSPDSWSYFLTPTPGMANAGRPLKQFIKEPTFFPLPSIVPEEIRVELEVESVEPVDIRYTTDGREPNDESMLYEHPINITRTTTFRVAAFIGQERVSPISTGTYLIDAHVKLPVLAITLDPADFNEVHMNIKASGRMSERQGVWEYFEPSGRRIEATGFGLRLHGGAGRNGSLRTKKSYRAYFRSSYGKGRLPGEIIPSAPVKNFDKLVLRASSNDRATHGSSIRDQVIRDLHLEMGGVAAHGSWCDLLINGVHRGVYNVTERMDQEFLASHLGAGQFDVIKTGETVLNGDKQAWDRLGHFLRTTHFSNQQNYEELKRKVDIKNFTSYVILNMCMQNFDWPHNNWYAARRVPDGRWIFMCWDSEWGLGYRHPHSGDAPTGMDLDPYAFMDSGGASGHGLIRSLFLALLSNEAYRTYYQQEVDRYLNGPLSTENILRLIHYHRDAIANELEKEYEARGSRIEQWHRQIEKIEHFTRSCTTFFKRYTQEYFNPAITFDENKQVALTTTSNGKRHVFYVANGGHLKHLASSTNGGPWQEVAMRMPKGAPSATGNPAAYSLTSGTLDVVYRGPAGSIHVLSCSEHENELGPWTHTNLSSLLSLPPAIRDPLAIVVDELPHLFYLDKDLQPHELWLDGNWRNHPLPTAPRPGGDIAVTSTPDAIHVTYRTMFGAPCIQRLDKGEMTHERRAWRHQIVLQIPALGTPTGLMADGKWRIVMRPATEWPLREPYVFHWDGPQGKGYQEYKGSRMGLIEGWKQRRRFHHLNPIGSPTDQAAGNPIVVTNKESNHPYVVYRDTEGHLQEAFLMEKTTPETWQIQDLTNLSNAPAAMSDPIGMVGTKGDQRYYIYWGIDQRLHELRFDGKWHHIKIDVATSPD